jgi:hypothetical protein
MRQFFFSAPPRFFSLTLDDIAQRFLLTRDSAGRQWLEVWTVDGEPMEHVLTRFISEEIGGKIHSVECFNQLLQSLIIKLEGGDPTSILEADPEVLYQQYRREMADYKEELQREEELDNFSRNVGNYAEFRDPPPVERDDQLDRLSDEMHKPAPDPDDHAAAGERAIADQLDQEEDRLWYGEEEKRRLAADLEEDGSDDDLTNREELK